MQEVKIELGKMKNPDTRIIYFFFLQRDYNSKSNISFFIAVRFGSVLEDLLLGM